MTIEFSGGSKIRAARRAAANQEESPDEPECLGAIEFGHEVTPVLSGKPW
jgi:hypothetical protein